MPYLPKIYASLQTERCIGHPNCKAAMICPTGALKQRKIEQTQIMINIEECIGCGKCVKACPAEAIILQKIMLE